ncbi:MAG: type II toxin-antitoxin system MqsA family antitoxin [Limisphaerales bacterium]
MSQTQTSGSSTGNGSIQFRCHVCGSTTAKSGAVNEVFAIEGRHVLVEHIPAQVCERCGEAVFSHETTERIRRLVHGTRPGKTVPLDVFALA